MSEKYNFTAIEKKWQQYWDEHNTFRAGTDYSKPKFYALVEFPYPSGQGLHIGHPRPYTAMDIVSRKRRLEGYNVLFPMGWDAFGLPTENYAIKNKIHPAVVTKKNIAHFKDQLKMLGLSFDWEREVDTTDPEYYRWTQWIFLEMFKKGLAYKKEMAVNWCTSCKVVLANEEVVGGCCERCGGEVIRKVKSQWMLKITEYAQRLLDDLSEVNYLDRIKSTQINWIGRSTGAEVNFGSTAGDILTVYTTRPDTLFGATYMVIAPEHPYIEKWADRLENIEEIKAYQEKAAKKSDFDRTEMNKDKTGVELKGVKGVNPVNGKEIPIFISDYVLMTYGTGAIMAVPAHDTRDYEFAKVFGLPIIEVVKGGDIEKEAFTDCATGIMTNSGFLDGLTVEEAKVKIKEWLEENGKGHSKVNYKLRDWVFSRQRYWGEPIPVVHCEKCGWVAIPEDQLPLTLPDVGSYMPTDNGESPLSTLESFINTTCPHCGGPAKRETDTMPQRSYSDVMAGVLLLFILIMSLTLFQAQKSYDESIQERDEKLALQAEYTADLLAKQNTIEEQEGTIKTKDEKLTALAQTLAEQEAKLKEQQALLNQQQMDLDEKTTQLSEQQTKIDNIIGVKAEVVEALQKEFQKNNINVNLDSQTGALTLDASVLFDVDESELTDAGKEALRNVLPIYCKVLMEDTYKNYLAEIIIDGYTDTDGDYAYNLELSQQRSLAVAQYLLDIQGEFLTEDQSLNLQDYLTVNGHSMANPILDADGNVDKEASRRVEVKFRLKDDEMIEELSKIMAGSEESAADTATEAGADAAAN